VRVAEHLLSESIFCFVNNISVQKFVQTKWTKTNNKKTEKLPKKGKTLVNWALLRSKNKNLRNL
jgi:hypothetical protein